MTDTAARTDSPTRAEPPRIQQPQFPGVTTPVEYEIRIHQAGQPGQFSTMVSALDGVEAALRVFQALRGTRCEPGTTLNLIAWSGADHDHAVGLIIAQHSWNHGDD
ncbi:hypothetical protein AB0A95_33890 [Micromonospora sp. NPDC049230]|uniref:hypothetical protein n=1 Tax=Micromonospora sp. NPDC049230 TaxID=3155502 RepID=UPI0033CD0466